MPRAGWPAFIPAVALTVAATAVRAGGAESATELAAEFDRLESRFSTGILPLIDRHCLDCHSTEEKKGELDLERFGTLAAVRTDTGAWEHALEQLVTGEMPPPKKSSLTPGERDDLTAWIGDFLDVEARSRAGDPGPVVLRRLNHAEFTWTVRDLTGVATLDPAREFPVDSAAGEGFTNTGDALVMSPALLEKYLEAGKEIAAHTVLLPDGFRFSDTTTRRDWTDAIVARIRDFYHARTGGEGIDFGYRQGKEVGDVRPAGASDGRIDLAAWFGVLVKHRDRLLADPGAAAVVAAEEGLNAKYFVLLADTLRGGGGDASNPLFEALGGQWRSASPDDAGRLAEWVRDWQARLWKFNPVGHLGPGQLWQEGIDPVDAGRTFRIPLAGGGAGESAPSVVTLALVAGTAGDGAEGDVVAWRNPRLERVGRPSIPLREVRAVAAGFERFRRMAAAQAEQALAAAFALKEGGARGAGSIAELADANAVHPTVLAAWLDWLGVGPGAGPAVVESPLTERIERVGGAAEVAAWGLPGIADLSIIANAGDELRRIPGELPGHRIAVHPRPERWVAAGWVSPIDGTVTVAAEVHDRHAACGNGVSWSVERHRDGNRRILRYGDIDNGAGKSVDPIEELEVRTGDLVALVVGARDRDHSCDLTEIDLVVRQAGGAGESWSLSADCADTLLAGNPHADRSGREGVWWFFSEPGPGGEPGVVIPEGSALAEWLEESDPSEAAALERKVAALLAGDRAPETTGPDAELRTLLVGPDGPLAWRGEWGALAALAVPADVEASPFGVHSARLTAEDGGEALIVEAPSAVVVRLPAGLVAGAEFVVDGALAGDAAGSVQLDVVAGVGEGTDRLVAGIPVTVRPGSAADSRARGMFAAFRERFPAALCYARVVPIDEVVTLNLFHREDDHLARLMLDAEEASQLDRLWDELHFVSQDAFQLETALEQILEFATQDADPSKFFPLREPVAAGAEALRRRLVEAEPSQLEALVAFAGRAFRRPLHEGEADDLRDLYARLRGADLPHDEAFRLTLARIFASPVFLYRAESPAPGAEPGPVSPWELATRLSYFLWSSAPDERLREAASSGRLADPEVLVAEARRLRGDDRIRRLAVEFACQWLHLRDFDQLDEKSERHFPEFADLRQPMAEEAIRFFADLFQNDRSILSILEADHTFVDARLAGFYGIPVAGNDEPGGWWRVDGLRERGRGGVLGMAAILARQSGASRTSPILRGNWVSETLLGERLPRPPKDVPQLPDTVPDGLSERQLIERHSSDPACVKCHRRIDPFGFALERFDAIGRARDLGGDGRPIDTRTALSDGTELDGLGGLRSWLAGARRETFVRQFCRKLLGYALGREVLLSDKPLLDEMAAQLEADGFRFGTALEAIVCSPQFREIRGAGAP